MSLIQQNHLRINFIDAAAYKTNLTVGFDFRQDSHPTVRFHFNSIMNSDIYHPKQYFDNCACPYPPQWKYKEF